VKETLQEYQEGLLWKVEDGDSLTVGVTQSAIDQVGSVHGVDFAEAGDELEAGDWIGEVQGKDSVVEILAPCRMRVTERNQEMFENPAILEDDPTGDAWMLRGERLHD